MGKGELLWPRGPGGIRVLGSSEWKALGSFHRSCVSSQLPLLSKTSTSFQSKHEDFDPRMVVRGRLFSSLQSPGRILKQSATWGFPDAFLVPRPFYLSLLHPQIPWAKKGYAFLYIFLGQIVHQPQNSKPPWPTAETKGYFFSSSRVL